jgi:tungstate transport system ATP-binding protein
MLYNLENVEKTYGNRTVLSIPELDLEPGKIYTLIGPNGAGKTTLLKILSFLDRPTGGHIRFRGEAVGYRKDSLLELRRKIVLLDQSPIMFSGPVLKNVEFGLKVRKVAKKQRLARVMRALEIVGMGHFLDYEAKSLSGGETKRVALARALVAEPEVLLCDEPTANVDNENQEIILNVLDEINKEHGCSVIFSTHYLSQAQRLADHTLLLQDGALSDLVNENIFRIKVVGRKNGTAVCQLSGQVFLEFPESFLPPGHDAAKLFIDPGKIELSPGRAESDEGSLLSGHLTELIQDRGQVRLCVNVGVNLNLILPLGRYRVLKPVIGDKVNLRIPHTSLTCTKITG